MSKYTYKTNNTCMKMIIAEIDDVTGEILDVNFFGGCPGNLSALSKILKGHTVQEVYDLFKGQTCGNKNTSCMDQFATMLEPLVNNIHSHI